MWIATAALTTFVVSACAKGTDAGTGGGDDGGGFEAGERDVNVIPTPDDGGSDSPSDTSVPPGDSATCDSTVVINELKTGPDEFVELYNPSTCTIALAGWSVKYESASGSLGGAGYAFVAADSIKSKGYFLMATVGTKDALWKAGMAATAGQIALLNDKSVIIDAVGYGSLTGGTYHEMNPAPAPASGKTIGRLPNGTDTDSNSADVKVLAAPSPGASN